MYADSLTIVAIPEPEHPVWKISSEKVPHMTILFLGDQSDNPNLDRIRDYIEHASKQIDRFGLCVDRRGLLGENDADVLFFDDLLTDGLKRFRSHLLAQDDISKAYESVTQYPSWTPHLTLGYPETPAKPDEREYPGIHWVNFDRIALWTGDYEGPEFLLNNSRFGEVSMSSVEDALEHFGTKGMKWGVRKGSASAGSTRADKKWGKKASKFSTFAKAYNSASKRMNDVEISRINNKPQYKKADFTHDSPLRKKYYKEFNDTFQKVINEETDKLIGTNPSGNRRLRYDASEGGNVTFRFEEVKHSDLEHAEDDAEFIAITDANGHIVGIRFADEDELGQSEEDPVDDILEHFGVLGMKWGTRRSSVPRNADGSETIVVTQKKPGSKLKAKGGKGHEADQDAVGAVFAARKAKKSGLQSLSNKELQALVQRMNLEQQYVGLKEKQPNVFTNGMKGVKKILALGKTANEVHQFVNSGAGKEFQKLLKI